MPATVTSTIDQDEIDKFSALAAEWWNESGEFRLLHKLNPVRITYIKDKIVENFARGESLKGLSVLDIGCGGGLLSEPIARLGAKVTAIDASEKNIKTAILHAKEEVFDIDYRVSSIEKLAGTGEKFDIVLCMEVIEHVADVGSFIKSCCEIIKPNGMIFFATINRTLKSLALAKIGAEYILRWLPAGTHQWDKFLRPSEIEKHLRANSAQLKNITGVSYNFLKDKWQLSSDISVNYMLCAICA